MNNNTNRKNKVINKIIISDTNNTIDDKNETIEDKLHFDFLEIMNGMKCIKNQVVSLKSKIDDLQEFLLENKR